MRRPVIAADHGGAVETIEHGVTGWRVPPGDPVALAAAIDRVLGLAPGRSCEALGRRARAAVLDRYTTAAMQRATLERVCRAARMRVLVIKLGALGDFVLAFRPFAAIRAHHRRDGDHAAHHRPVRRAGAGRAVVRPGGGGRAAAPGGTSPGCAGCAGRCAASTSSMTCRPPAAPAGISVSPGRPAWSGIARGASHPHANPARNRMHTLERQRDQLEAAGITRFPEPDLAWLTGGGPVLPGPYAMLAPGSAPHRPEKRWPADRFGALARLLQGRGVRPVVVGTSADAPLAAAIVAACPEALDLTGRTSAARPRRPGRPRRARGRQRHRPHASRRRRRLPVGGAVLGRVRPRADRAPRPGHRDPRAEPGRSRGEEGCGGPPGAP